MKRCWWISSLLLLFIVTGCKKEGDEMREDGQTKFPPPAWKGDETGRYPATMAAVLALPASLESGIGAGDQLAAFVGEECRGVGDVVKVDTKQLYFILIRGASDEQSKVVFKYYNAKSGYMYRSTQELGFLVDAVYGTAANPKLLELTAVK